MRRITGPILAGTVCLLFACGGTGDTVPDATAMPGDKYSIEFGPVTVAPAQESTQCIQVRLGNAGEIKVNEMRNTLTAGSHHMIVYKDDMTTTEQRTPFDCEPFTGALNATGMVAPIMITQRADDTLYLPEGVGYTLAANQMMRIEMHFINSTELPIEVRATAEFFAAPEGAIRDEANILFIGSPDIDIKAGETKTLHQFFTFPTELDLSTSKVFAITGHTHRLGTDVKVNVAASPTSPMTMVYAPVPFSWSEPETTTHDPGFAVPKGGGFDFACTYRNTTTADVGFGESANDEMCFFWAYYYPSQGSRVCIHTEQAGGHDICCPGDSLCGLVGEL